MLQGEDPVKDRQGLIGVDHVATVSMYYADPGGNQMEVQVDAFDTAEECNDFMCGPVNAENPVGVEYDPEDWLAQMRSGTPASDFLNRQIHEPKSPIRGALAMSD